MISREVLFIIESPTDGHIPGDREAWNTYLEECDAFGADSPRVISCDTKFGVDVAVQPYTEIMIIDGVNLCLGKAGPSTEYNTPKSSPNSVIFGGMIVPAATSPILMDA
jgi:hypothetical protein